MKARGRYLYELHTQTLVGAEEVDPRPLEVMPPRERTRDLVRRYVERLGFVPPVPEQPDDPPGLELPDGEDPRLAVTEYMLDEAVVQSVENQEDDVWASENGSDEGADAEEQLQEGDEPPLPEDAASTAAPA